MRIAILVLWMLASSIAPLGAQAGPAAGASGESLGIDLPAYPELLAVSDQPVYYAPQVKSNYFFYDGLYWIYQHDSWHASAWYNGPWHLVGPDAVPDAVLRVPVRYFRRPPAYFRAWGSDTPPRWDEFWGREWEQRRPNWNEWSRKAAMTPAPLSRFQGRYTGAHYPQPGEQPAIQDRHYRHEPSDVLVQQLRQALRARAVPASGARDGPAAKQALASPPREEAGRENTEPRHGERSR